MSFVAKEPDSGRFFRIGEAEYFIAQQLDGSTSLEEVRRLTETHFQTRLKPEALRACIERLDAAGLPEQRAATADRLGALGDEPHDWFAIRASSRQRSPDPRGERERLSG